MEGNEKYENDFDYYFCYPSYYWGVLDKDISQSLDGNDSCLNSHNLFWIKKR